VSLFHQELTLECSWILRPVLRRIGDSGPLERLAAARLGPSFPGLHRIVGGERFRAPRPAFFELFENLACEAGEPHLGLEAINARPAETLLDYLLRTAPTLGAALVTACRMNRLQNDQPHELEDGKALVARHQFWTDQARQSSEAMAATLVQIVRTSTDERWAPLEIRFPFRRPASTARLEEFFRCPIRFGAPAFEVHVSREDRELPFRGSDPALHRLLMRHALKELARIPNPNSTAADQVRVALREAIPHGDATLMAIADRLKMRPDALERRLVEDGTGFSTLLVEERRRLATQLLSTGTRTFRDVASAVGFPNASALRRALLRFEGEKPGGSRKRPLDPT
jgi:AraC-like DNA-binding protein